MGIMYGLGILFGFLLFIIPGIILATVWLLAWFVLVDRDVLPTQALGKSYELVPRFESLTGPSAFVASLANSNVRIKDSWNLLLVKTSPLGPLGSWTLRRTT